MTVGPGGIEAVGRDIAAVVVGVLSACGGDAENRAGEGRAGDAIALLNDQPAVGRVAVFERDSLAGFHLDRLRRIVQHITGLCLGLPCDHGEAGVKIVNEDRSGAVRCEIPVAVAEDRAGAVRDEKADV